MIKSMYENIKSRVKCNCYNESSDAYLCCLCAVILLLYADDIFFLKQLRVCKKD